MKCSDLRNFNINRTGEYIANIIKLDNSNKNICKVNIDYSANVIADNTNYVVMNIGIYRKDETNNSMQLIGNIYRYAVTGDFKEYFSVFLVDNEICKGCYSYIVIYNVNNEVTTGTLKVINSNIRLIVETI
nr:DUF4489 domain-containing protein [Clostridium gallinarum]